MYDTIPSTDKFPKQNSVGISYFIHAFQEKGCFLSALEGGLTRLILLKNTHLKKFYEYEMKELKLGGRLD